MRVVELRGPYPELGASNSVLLVISSSWDIRVYQEKKYSWDTKVAGTFHGFKSNKWYTGQKGEYMISNNELQMLNHVLCLKREDTRNSTHFPSRDGQAA